MVAAIQREKAKFHSVQLRGTFAGKDRGAGRGVQALVDLYFSRGFLPSDWTVGFLIKSFSGDELLDAVNAASKWKPNNSGS